jgi:hypothetical protein
MSFKRRILEENKGVLPLLGGAALGGLAGGALGHMYGDDIASSYLNHSQDLVNQYDQELEAFKDKISSEYPVSKQMSDPEGFEPYKEKLADLRGKYWGELFGGIKRASDISEYATPALGLGGVAAGTAAGAGLNALRQRMSATPKA